MGCPLRLSPKKFNKFLNGIGQEFTWAKSFSCPCTNPQSGAPRRDCPQCDGKGRLWDSPIDAKAGVVSRSQLKKFAEFGIWDEGDIVLSIPSDSELYAIGQFDQVATKNRTEPFSVNIINGFANTLRFKPESIDRVTWLDGDDLIVGSIPTINQNGALAWSGLTPPQGVTYAITGRRFPVYFCYMDLPLDRPYHSGEDLPRRVVLRRFDLFGR